MKADLHCHTVLSDGAMRVDQIIPYAKRIGLDHIAISEDDILDTRNKLSTPSLKL